MWAVYLRGGSFSSWAGVTVVKPGLSAVDDAESGCGETERQKGAFLI